MAALCSEPSPPNHEIPATNIAPSLYKIHGCGCISVMQVTQVIQTEIRFEWTPGSISVPPKQWGWWKILVGIFLNWIDRWRWTQPMQTNKLPLRSLSWYAWYTQSPGCPRQHQDHPEPLNKQFLPFDQIITWKMGGNHQISIHWKNCLFWVPCRYFFPGLWGEHHETRNLKVLIFAWKMPNN